MMEFDALYHERMDFRLMYIIAAFLGLISLSMLGLLIYHVTVAPIDNEPGLGWFFLTESLILGAVAVLVLQFHTLDIILTYQRKLVYLSHGLRAGERGGMEPG